MVDPCIEQDLYGNRIDRVHQCSGHRIGTAIFTVCISRGPILEFRVGEPFVIIIRAWIIPFFKCRGIDKWLECGTHLPGCCDIINPEMSIISSAHPRFQFPGFRVHDQESALEHAQVMLDRINGAHVYLLHLAIPIDKHRGLLGKFGLYALEIKPF